jgi:hypothetical protein
VSLSQAGNALSIAITAALLVGLVTMLVAERRGRQPIRWAILGAWVAAIGGWIVSIAPVTHSFTGCETLANCRLTTSPTWISWVGAAVALAPIAAAFLLPRPPAPSTDPFAAPEPTTKGRWGQRIVAGVGLWLVGVIVVMSLKGFARNATSPLTIVTKTPTTWDNGGKFHMRLNGYWVDFEFVWNGTRLDDHERVQWTAADFEGAKVCYDPSDKQNDSLKPAWFTCGSFDPSTPDRG